MINYFVPAEDFERPLSWYGEPLPPNLVARYLESYTRPGDAVLDPFAQSPALIEEGLARGLDPRCAHFHPIHVLIARGALQPPLAELIDSLLTRLGDSPKLGAPLRQHIQDLYRSRCSHCDSPVLVSALIWQEGSLSQKDYRCATCDGHGPSTVEETDQELARSVERRGTHYWYLLERTAPPGDEERRLVMSLLNLYPPRSLYALVTLFIKLESLFSDPGELDAARLLFVLTLERCSQFGRSLPERPLPGGRLRRGPLPLLEELNVWLCLEEAGAQLKAWAQRRPLAEGFDLSGRVRQATPRDPASGGFPHESQALVLGVPPPFDFGYWALGYLWTAWLFGLEAAEPLRPLIKAQAPDGTWYRRMMAPTLGVLTAQLRPQGVLALATQRSDPVHIAQLLAAGAQAQLHLEDLLLQTKPTPAGPRARLACRFTWRKAAAPAAGASPPRDRDRLAEEAIAEALSAREEALELSTLLLAVLRRWGQAGVSPAPETPFTELENEVRRRLIEGPWSRLGAEEDKSEYWWWDDDRDPEAPLVDRIQKEVESFLPSSPGLGYAEARQRTYQQFPGLATPPEGLIETYLTAHGPSEAGWWPRPPAALDQEEAIRTLVELGERVELRTWWRSSGVPSPAQLTVPIDVAWLEDEGPLYLFILRTTSQVADLYRWARRGESRGRHLIVVPDERSEFLQVALGASPLLRHRFRQGNWDFIKLGHLRDLSNQPEIDRHEIKKIIGLAPLIESPEAQLPLFP